MLYQPGEDTRPQALEYTPAPMRLNMSDLYAQREWAIRFGCTREELREAVAVVGCMVSDIADDLWDREK
jgi:hypothetical protein